MDAGKTPLKFLEFCLQKKNKWYFPFKNVLFNIDTVKAVFISLTFKIVKVYSLKL